MTVDGIVRRIASFGLPGHQRAAEPEGFTRLTETPLDPSDFDRVMREVRVLRLTGFLQAVLAAEALPVTAEQRERAVEAHMAACAVVLGLERTLLDLVEELERHGVEVVVLKGSASAHLLYPDPSLRMFGDNDLLFRSEQFDRALEVLAELGYRRPAAARPGFARRSEKGVTLIGVDGDEVEAHRTVLSGSFGRTIDTRELFVSTVWFRLGGRQLRALDPDTGLLHACYHAALGDPDPRLGSLRELAQRFALQEHDPGRVLEIMRRWETGVVVARAVELVHRHLGVAVIDPVADEVAGRRPTARERRAIDSYIGENRSHAARMVASLANLRGNRAPMNGAVRSHGRRSELPRMGLGGRSLRSGGRR
jgi:hypothetical protein